MEPARSRRTLPPPTLTDLEGLSAKIAEAQGLDTSIKAKDTELQSLQVQIDSLADSAQKLREGWNAESLCRAALGDVPYETLAADLAALDPEPTDKLRVRRQQASSDLELARAAASRADTAHTLAEERAGNSGSALNTAVARAGCRFGAFN